MAESTLFSSEEKNDNVFSLKIIVSGKTKPGVKVRLATSAQWIIEKEIQSIEVNNLRYNNSKMVEQNEDGGFTLTLEVPTNGTLHLPIYLIEDQHHQSQLLVLKMDEERLFQKMKFITDVGNVCGLVWELVLSTINKIPLRT